MAVSEQLKTLVEQMPDPDGRGMYTENIDKEKIEKAVEAIYKGGRANMQGLVEMLGEPGSDEDVKPHYALHSVLNHTLIVGDEKAQKEFCDVLAAELSGNHSDYIKSYLCQELQWAGDRAAVPALGKLLTDEELCDPAAMALVAINDGAADELRKAVPQAKGKSRLAVMDALAALADDKSATAFKDALTDEDREVRIAGGVGLSKLGDPGSVDLLTKAADVEPGWERIQAAKNCLVLAENLSANGKKSDAQKVYKYLHDSRKDPTEKYIRDLAAKAMSA